MDIAILAAVCFYIVSTAAYFSFLFFQKSALYRTGLATMSAGFALHTILMAITIAAIGGIPAKNLHQTLFLAGWSLAGVFLGLQFRYPLKVLGVFAAPLAALTTAVAFQLPQSAAVSAQLFNNLWLVAHIIAIFLGEAALAMACGAGVLYLIQEQSIKTKRHGFFYKRLPALDRLDSTGYACIVVGFSLLTLGLATGLVYAKTHWGRFWSWDPKEVWSAITWLIYAALLHQRLTIGWRGRQAAFMAIIGFAVILFTFFGVNFLLDGHHSEFTRL